jgi:cytochrome c5
MARARGLAAAVRPAWALAAALALAAVAPASAAGAGAAGAASPPGPSAGAGAPREVGPRPDHEGYPLYQRYCAECHGVRADGHGPRATLLDPRPPDLTHLHAADGGPPRLEALVHAIDGRRVIPAHGKMPVWGRDLVAGEPDLELRERARARLVQSLATYLLAIQQPAGR